MNPNRPIKRCKRKVGIGTFIETKYTDYDLYDRIYYLCIVVLKNIRLWDIYTIYEIWQFFKI